MKIVILLLHIVVLVSTNENGNLTIVRYENKLYVAPRPFISSIITNVSNPIPIQLDQHVSPQIRRKVLTEYKEVCRLIDRNKGCVVLPLPIWQVSVGFKERFGDGTGTALDTQWQNIQQGSTPHITLLRVPPYNHYNSSWIIKYLQLELRSIRRSMIVPITLTMREMVKQSGTDIWNLISHWGYSSSPLGPKPYHKQWEDNILAWIEDNLMKDQKVVIASETERIQLKKDINRAVNSDETLEAMGASLDKMNSVRRSKSSSTIVLNTTVAVLHKNDTVIVPFQLSHSSTSR